MSLSHPAQITIKPERKRKVYKKCNECNRRRRTLDESHQICHVCYKLKTVIKQSGNKVIDDFIRYTQTNYVDKDGKMEFVPYDQFKNIEFIAEGGFSKIYKATWIDGPIFDWYRVRKDNYIISRNNNNYTVVLKKLNNSESITLKELNELKVFYQIYTKSYHGHISDYFGITQDPITKDIVIIMPYYDKGDLIHYLSNDFYNIDWIRKLTKLSGIINGLKIIHSINIIHRDLHSGNIFCSAEADYKNTYIGDFGISKSASESTDNNEKYGIIPYMAPEIFQGQKYTTASDIYSFGMIMWEVMTARRPFWDEIHDIELIIKICDGLRPPIVTNAPEGYIELMKECWHSIPENRPTAHDICGRISEMWRKEKGDDESNNPTKIIKSSDIGPVTTNNPGAIYRSRPLSKMIQSAMSTRSLRSQSSTAVIDSYHCYNVIFNDKRKLEVNQIENGFDDGRNTKKIKLIENRNNDYVTKESELDIEQYDNNDEEYTTQEIEFDIKCIF